MIDLIRREERRRANMPLQQAGVACERRKDLAGGASARPWPPALQQQQSLVLLRDYEGYSYEEIGRS
ncbi:MAG: RNA polymerase sigma factor, partial [Bacteroidetes bacterium]|nr:RNA polymerase sigma factor [Bacteroidota bacterium]